PPWPAKDLLQCVVLKTTRARREGASPLDDVLVRPLQPGVLISPDCATVFPSRWLRPAVFRGLGGDGVLLLWRERSDFLQRLLKHLRHVRSLAKPDETYKGSSACERHGLYRRPF